MRDVRVLDVTTRGPLTVVYYVGIVPSGFLHTFLQAAMDARCCWSGAVPSLILSATNVWMAGTIASRSRAISPSSL